MAVIHPLMFTLRRISYALAIVLLPAYSLFGVWTLLCGTLLMLAFAMTEAPWRDEINNHQHIFNEFITYIVCIFLVLFNGYLDAQTRHELGYTLVAIISIYIVYNGIIMLRKITKLCQLLVRKWRTLRRQRSLRAEAQMITQRIKATYQNMFMKMDPDDDLDGKGGDGRAGLEKNVGVKVDDEEYDDEERPKISLASLIRLDLLPMSTGGLRLNIGNDEKKIALLQKKIAEQNAL